MPVEVFDLWDKNQTLEKMTAIVKNHAVDLTSKGYEKLSFPEWFDIVRKTQYKPDKRGVEIVATPAVILKGRENGTGADCKKKACLIASWFELNGIPWRFVTSSTRADKKIHHVFVQYQKDGNWINADATYRYFKIGQPKRLTAFEVYTGA